MEPKVHLVKLCVGAESVADLRDWQARRLETGETLAHVTRMWPKRADEILEGGGSLYWVIRGVVLVRQRIAGFERHRGSDGFERCAILLEPAHVRTVPQPRRPFQGWRYLAPGDAPADLEGGAGCDLPPSLAAALAAVGVV
jgi:hypothetical protein